MDSSSRDAHAARVAEVFRKHDRDASGTMDAGELEAALAELGALPKAGDAKLFVAGLMARCEDVDGDRSSLTLTEFHSLFDLGRVRRAFAEVDVDGSGAIDAKEMARALRALGVRSATLEDARRLLATVDKDGEGTVDLAEFEAAFEFVPLASLENIAERWSSLGELPDLSGNDLGAATKPVAGLKVWQTVLAGGTAGVVSRTLTAPLERVKVAAQTGFSTGGVSAEFRRILAAEGPRGLFAGNAANCVRVFPTAAITCTAYINLLKLTPADDDFDPYEPLYRSACAGTAALVGNVLTYPLDVVRARLTVGAGGSSFRGVVAALYADGGSRAFYRGLGPTLAAVVPFVAVQNSVIDAGRSIHSARDPEPPSYAKLGLIGAAAGAAAQTVTYPLDVLRRRLQVLPGEASAAVVADRTWLSVARGLGVRSLFAGIVPTYAKTVPAVATVSCVCVSMNTWFKQANAA